MVNIPLDRRWLLLSVAAMLAGILIGVSHHRRPGSADPPAAGARSENPPAAWISTAASGAVAPLAPVAGNALFSFASPANAAALDAALPAPAQVVHYVRINAALIAGKQSPFWQKPGAGRVEWPLDEGGAVMVVITASEMLGPRRFTSTGRIEGRPASRVVFAWNEGFLNASLEDPALGAFALRTANAEFAQFYQVDPALVAACGGERRPVIDGSVLAAAEARRARSGEMGAAAPASPPAAAADNPQRAEVHVMMVYTQAVKPTLTGATRVAALQSEFDAAIARVNLAFEASLITARVKLVKIAETQYPPDEPTNLSNRVQDDALTALYKTGDGKMDEIHALRDQSGADIVCLVLNHPDSVSSGLSFLLDTPESAANADFAFSVVQYSNIAGTNVVPHELGHVFGCAHDREHAYSGPGAYSFSYGYRFVGADGQQYRDIMSYPPGIELGYFSNPDVMLPPPVNARMGVAPGLPGEADAALTIERTAFAVSIFRLQTQAAPNLGTLVNVATRAFVGGGEQVLIAGFVVEGTQPKTMLLRGVGPALAAFGVTDALADPVLRIYSGANRIAESDNWGDQAGAADISAAARQAGAFAFAPNSADAAVLVTLAPDAYTAVVEGVAGATGSGLVEAYEVGRSTSRIVNLATRGYADAHGREMLGGFVVEGAAGTTKRILIRVLGPTLSRAPFNLSDTLDDPWMEIRNAAGDVLVQNDDWSSDSEGGVSAANDFSPKVTTYGEQQIFATGFAPANRRESCVMADLPPGSYTVLVRPFERRDPDPRLDQPAVPGVGIVEVYEINR